MGPAWAQVHLTGDLWLPLLWLLLSQVCCFHGLPGWRFTSSEVVIPRKVSHKVSGAGVQDQLSYKIHFRGRRHVVHMKVKKNLLPRNFPVITNNDQGAMQEDYPFVPRNCYYYSYLEGVPGSMGTLDTCYGGLRGMLQVDDFTYEIKPLEASSKFEHVVSQLVSEKRASETERCQIEAEDASVADEELLAELPRSGPVYFWWPHWKILKLHYTISYSLYEKNRNHTVIVDNIVIMNNIMHSIYMQLNMNVFIRMICIWDDNDEPVRLHGWGSASAAASEFGVWKYWDWWFRYPHDTSLLLTGHQIAGSTYFTFQGGICNPNWGVAYVYAGDYHLFLLATISAHCLAHTIGLGHDQADCKCFRRESCVMASVPGLLDMFSNCSYNLLFGQTHPTDNCLSKKYSQYTNFPYISPRCGDKNIDKHEECDCGSFKECAQNKCCETHCALSLGSDCNEGLCCIKCHYAQPGWNCRKMSGICDLPEYCDGKTHVCPDDTYIQDGTPCSPLAVCMVGNCTDREMQCRSLFGLQAKDGPPACYEKLNAVGDRFGNCGLVIKTYSIQPRACEPEHVFCGLLHCSDVDQVPGGGEHTSFHDIITQDIESKHCFGFDVHLGTQVPSFGLVVDGATCAPGRYCRNQNCTFYGDFKYDCDISKCNFRGVCNNRGKCYCQRGWKPPDCKEVGVGGSENSGIPPQKDPHGRAKVLMSINKALTIMFLRAVLFFLSVLAGILTSVHRFLKVKTVVKKHRRRKHK